MKYTILLLAALLCGCEAKLSVSQSDSPPPVESATPVAYGLEHASAYRVVTDGTNYSLNVLVGPNQWYGITDEFPSIDDACAWRDRAVATLKRIKEESEARGPRELPTRRKANWTNLPPILECDK